jgi:hypothetical protein
VAWRQVSPGGGTAGIAAIIGLALAPWSASGYVAASAVLIWDIAKWPVLMVLVATWLPQRAESVSPNVTPEVTIFHSHAGMIRKCTSLHR